jgi:hypothetical protein
MPENNGIKMMWQYKLRVEDTKNIQHSSNYCNRNEQVMIKNVILQFLQLFSFS